MSQSKAEYLRQYRAVNRERLLAQKRAYYAENRERLLDQKRVYYVENRDVVLEKVHQHRAQNADKVNAKAKEYREANRAAVLGQKRQYHSQNRETILEQKRQYRAENHAKCRANGAKRRAAEMQRTPRWLSEEDRARIEAVYAHAKECEMLTGERYEVDHVIPLRGRTVSGLHVPWNLQVLPMAVNRAKYNGYEGPDSWAT